MPEQHTTRSGWRAAAMTLLGCALLCSPLAAQVSGYGDKQTGRTPAISFPQVLQKVGVTQKLNQQLPLDAEFVDGVGQDRSSWRLLRKASRDPDPSSITPALCSAPRSWTVWLVRLRWSS